MISLKDVAASCGVSIATVSKALNNQNDIGEETKLLVRQTADKMGYWPNASAQALRTKRSHTIGVLFGDENGSGLTDEFYSHVFNALKRAAESRGYEIVFLSKKIGSHTRTYMEHCRYRSVDGVLLGFIPNNDEQVLEIIGSDLPVVTVDHAFDHKTSVTFDYVQGMRDLVTYICEMGHRKIAYIHGQQSYTTRCRLSSFYMVMEQYGITVPDKYVRESGYLDFQKAAEITSELLDLPEPPTCIIYPNDFSSMGGIGAIRQRGLSIPDNISVVGYDGIPLSRAMTPPLTTLVQDFKEMGEVIASQLINQIENARTATVERITVKGKVEPGNSVKKILI
ncbi:MAG TPA: LacI family DNA-binding transcriptional regulator [Lachnospiraceae bacterium]|nr:LacI family DNA-binding transcriptional regulator [Lachnospiraceae bacterium]